MSSQTQIERVCEGESITLSISLFAAQLLFLYNLFIKKID